MTKKPTYEELELRVKELEQAESERKQTEEPLRESESTLRRWLETSFTGVLFSDYEGNIEECNDAFLDIIGYTRDDLESKRLDWRKLTPPEWLHLDEIGAQELVEKGRLTPFEKEYIHKNGYRVPILLGGAVREDDSRKYIIHIVDLTQIKKAEDALLESENNFRSLAENVNDGILIAIDDGVHIFANKRASEITGYTTSELLGATIKDLAHPDEFDGIIERYRKIISGKPFPTQYETMIINKDGEVVPIEVSSAKTVWQGKPADIVSIRDITERQQMARALREAHDELEQRVEERTRELELKTKSLEELNTAMKVLLKKREEDKIEVEQNVMTNVRELISPYFDKINETKLDDHQKAFLNIVESNLNEIVSPFTRKLSLKYMNLTPREIQIVNMIKIGYQSKKIAKIMKVSPRTIDTHRKNIRSKIGLGHKRANLRSHILAHEQ